MFLQKKIKRSTEYRLVRKEFDVDYYSKENIDIASELKRNPKFDAVKHYLKSGWKENRDPNNWFSTSGYLHFNPDVRRSGVNPFLHYMRHGKNEVRYVPSPWGFNEYNSKYHVCEEAFDAEYYWTTYPDVQKIVGSMDRSLLLYHFMSEGWKLNWNPNQEFVTSDYLFLNPDVQVAGVNPFYHYLTAGVHENRPTKQFSEKRSGPKVLFVGHSAIKSGAEIMLLDILKWYDSKTNYSLDVILLSGGSLVSEYLKVSRVSPMSGIEDFERVADSGFLQNEYDLIYINTVVSACLLEKLSEFFGDKMSPVLLHVHEMKSVILPYVDMLMDSEEYISQYVFASDGALEDYRDTVGIRDENAEIMYSFVPKPGICNSDIHASRIEARDKLSIGHESAVILMSGTVYERKGPDIFLEVASKVVSVNENCVFVWLGEGPLLEECREKIENLNLTHSVRFVGYTDNSRELVAAADIFFLSSREDPFPLVCLEAAHFAVPTVHFEGATGIERLTRAGGGCSTPAFDTSLCASLILELVQRRSQREAFGIGAKSLVVENYSLEAAMLRHLALVRRVADIPPEVSVIVPNYNHERYLARRLYSVCEQSFADIEIIVLDDASTDNSLGVVDNFKRDPRLRVIANHVNSGSPFAQWMKGLDEANGRLIWVAESDDECSANLLEKLIPAFSQSDCVISYCRTDTGNDYGLIDSTALDSYLEETGRNFNEGYYISGQEEIDASMGFRCTLVNASSAVFRADALRRAVPNALDYKLCGDWRVYVELLKTGSISYIPDRLNYFRRHPKSAIHALEGSDVYFQERMSISEYVVTNYKVNRRTAYKIVDDIKREWERFRARHPKEKTLDDIVDLPSLQDKIRIRPTKLPTVALYVHGYLFSKGGIEQQGAAIAKRLANRGYKVAIFCRVWGDAAPVYDAGGLVEVVPVFDENNCEASIARLARELIDREIDVFIPMLSEWLFEPMSTAAKIARVPFIASEHNDPWVIEELWWSHEARMKCFREASRIHLLSSEFKASLEPHIADRAVVLPNGVEGAHRPRNWVESPPSASLIAVGRLVKQKGFDRLIKAMPIILKKIPECRLDIFGEGPLLDELQALIKSLRLEQSVFLRGRSDIVISEMRKASVFVLPSRFEGFGIVIAEAKSIGIPSIAYKDCNGANGLIRDGVDGLLVDGSNPVKTMAEAILRLLQDPDFIISMSDEALSDSKRFDIEQIVDRWEDEIMDVFHEV